MQMGNWCLKGIPDADVDLPLFYGRLMTWLGYYYGGRDWSGLWSKHKRFRMLLDQKLPDGLKRINFSLRSHGLAEIMLC